MSKMSVDEVKEKFHEALERFRKNPTREAHEEVQKWRVELMHVSTASKRSFNPQSTREDHMRQADEIRSRVKKRVEALNKRMMSGITPITFNPRLREATDDYMSRLPIVGDQHVCPECGSTETSNRGVSGRGKRKKSYPLCIKCNIPLVPKSMLDRWKRQPKVKLRKKFTDEERRMGWG